MHIDYLRQCLDNEAPVDASIHARFRELFHQYVIVGGMPEAVTAFLNTRQIGKVLAIQRRIVDEYKADMVKYALLADKPKIRECFESIPSQLSREYKKFTFSTVRPGGRGRDYVGSLQWIVFFDHYSNFYLNKCIFVGRLLVVADAYESYVACVFCNLRVTTIRYVSLMSIM